MVFGERVQDKILRRLSRNERKERETMIQVDDISGLPRLCTQRLQILHSFSLRSLRLSLFGG